METSTIECLLDKTFRIEQLPAKFYGVFPADEIPLPLEKFPACFVANTDPAGKRGTHWVAFYHRSPTCALEFFDSYGMPPEVYGFRGLPPLCVHSERTLQAIDSDVCGDYCVFFLVRRSRTRTLTDTLNALSSLGKTPRERDSAVRMLVRQYRHYPPHPSSNHHERERHAQCCVPRNFISHSD